jgi:hypothetical protein
VGLLQTGQAAVVPEPQKDHTHRCVHREGETSLCASRHVSQRGFLRGAYEFASGDEVGERRVVRGDRVFRSTSKTISKWQKRDMKTVCCRSNSFAYSGSDEASAPQVIERWRQGISTQSLKVA